MSIYIDPESLRGGSSAADIAANRLKAVSHWGAPSPEGISGRTTALINQGKLKAGNAGEAGSRQAIYLRTTAMLAINIDGNRCSGALAMDPLKLVKLTDPFGRNKRPGAIDSAQRKVQRHIIGLNVGAYGVIPDGFHAIVKLGDDIAHGRVKVTREDIAKQLGMSPNDRMVTAILALGKQSIKEVKERSSKNQGAQAVGRTLGEIATAVSGIGKIGTAAKGAQATAGTGRVARTIRAADKATIVDVRALASHGYKEAAKKRAAQARSADNTARARVQSLNAHPPAANASASARASYDTERALALREREVTRAAKEKAIASERNAAKVTARAEIASEIGIKIDDHIKEPSHKDPKNPKPLVCQ